MAEWVSSSPKSDHSLNSACCFSSLLQGIRIGWLGPCMGPVGNCDADPGLSCCRQIPVRSIGPLNVARWQVSVIPFPRSGSSAILHRTNLPQPAWLESRFICLSLTPTRIDRWRKEEPHGSEVLSTVFLRRSIRLELPYERWWLRRCCSVPRLRVREAHRVWFRRRADRPRRRGPRLVGGNRGPPLDPSHVIPLFRFPDALMGAADECAWSKVDKYSSCPTAITDRLFIRYPR